MRVSAQELIRGAPPGWRVSRGLIDLQVNGAGGHEIGEDPEANAAVSRALPRAGTTTFLPTLVSRSLPEYEACAEAFATTSWPDDGARSLGLHLEGPFLAPSRHGAHDPEALLLPSRSNVDAILGALRPRAITMAPELPGAIEAIERLSADDVAVFVGHTDADAEIARAAVAAGATLLTHAFNAMRGIETRGATALGAFLTDAHAAVSVIADGVHVHPENLRLIRPLIGPRLVLISDASAPAGGPPGSYMLGSRPITFDGERVTCGAGLAGSGSLLDEGVRVLADCGWSVEDALTAATDAPAAIVNETTPNDAVLWDDQLRVRLTVVDGHVAYRDAELPVGLS